jgi:hypothetical protein
MVQEDCVHTVGAKPGVVLFGKAAPTKSALTGRAVIVYR